MLVSCEGPDCDVEFEARRPNAKYHADKCRKAAARIRTKLDAIEAANPKNAKTTRTSKTKGNDGSGRDSELVKAVQSQLTKAGRLDTIAGQSAVLLATRASEVGATGTSALIKEMTEAVERALEDVAPDVICIHCGKHATRPEDQVSRARDARAKKASQAATR